MKFKLTKSSDWNFKDFVEVNNLDDLKRLQYKYGHAELIIDFDDATIEIYDDYRE